MVRKVKVLRYPNNRIKELRLKNNYTQQELADLMDVNIAMISRWERNLDNPYSDVRWEKLAEIFNTSVDYTKGI